MRTLHVPNCECCGSYEGIEREDSRTCYDLGELNVWDRLLLPVPYKPPTRLQRDLAANPSVMLCRTCASEHHAYWDDMWSNVPGWGGYYDER